MSGAVTELVALGVQDTYLTGDPQMSFFRQVYKRHTNFALESVRQIFKGQPATSGMSSITLKRAGDLVNGIYLMVDGDSPVAPGAAPSISNMIDRVELYIGGQKIDEYSGRSACVFSSAAVVPKSYTGILGSQDAASRTFHPLHFFCCEDSNSPLPLVALQYHDVDVRIYWDTTETPATNLTLYANYTYLDTQERNVFAQNKQELLITQHQELTWTGAETIIDLPFSHPVKTLFISERDTATNSNAPVAADQTGRLTLELNGQQRFEPQNSTFFQTIQPYYYGSPQGYINSVLDNRVHTYSFALNYGQTQPSGTLNFSRIDNARWHVSSGGILDTNVAGGVLRCNAINYNILKCENGMGGLLFAN